ncbi:MAG: 4-alpha-glucanotransferase [Chloroflexi bacterium]|nr:4-alpha-glucanotransferase [Chloroflexota bacterium]
MGQLTSSSKLQRRGSGVLLHPTSLPGRLGIGDLGPAAFAFLDYLASARQTLWQVLPLGPTGYGDSPYSSPSAFAGNPLLIGLEPLVEQGLLGEGDVAPLAELPMDHVEFGRLLPLKRAALETAFVNGRDRLRPEMEEFQAHHAEWLSDFSLFAALRDQSSQSWTDWDADLRSRDAAALGEARQRLEDRVGFHTFCQYLFFTQWAALRRRAAELQIHIVGDIPVFVAHDSADVWAHQRIFKLDPLGKPRVVAGVPPDYFSATGQLWGNPLYDWEAIADERFGWWINRFRHLLEEVDVVRIDHFRGFEAAWEVPFGELTAVNGQWVPGPGSSVFEAIASSIGGDQPPVVAEDLGLITEEVRSLLRTTGFPGMKVLQFAFGDDARNPYLPHNYPDANCLVYTGTHDNDTTRGWFAAISDDERAHVCRYVGTDGSRIAEDLMRLALASVARTAIVPLQDVLDLGSEARMNTPGRPEGNWAWRVQPDQLTPERAACLAEMTSLYGRAV